MNGAGGVNQKASGRQQRHQPIQEGLLLGQKPTDGVRRHPPTGIRVSRQSAKTRAGGINQDPLKGFTPLGTLLQQVGGICGQGMNRVQLQPGGIGRNALEPSGRTVDSPDLCLIPHQLRQMGGFPPRRSAGIQDAIPRLGIEQRGNRLG